MHRLFKLSFNAPAHIGIMNIDKTANTICADTIFSALCCEALKKGGAELIEGLVSYAKRGELMFTDALPFIDKAFFIPSPRTCALTADSYELNKALKKLPFISAEKADIFLSGDIDEDFIADNKQHLSKLGMADTAAKAQIPGGGADTEPYHIGIYTFGENAGLYIIVTAEETAMNLFRELINGVSHAGLGGRRSCGYGRFSVTEEDVPGYFTDGMTGDFPVYITLSVSLPNEREAEDTFNNAAYTLLRRGGFVYSDTYSETPVRKNDLYVMAAGAVVKNRFSGDVYDVSNPGYSGAHAVYRYAKPVLLGVSV